MAGVIWVSSGGGLDLVNATKPAVNDNEDGGDRGRRTGANDGNAGAQAGRDGATPTALESGAPGGKEGGHDDRGGKDGGKDGGKGKGKDDGERALPCDPDELIAAINYANANGGGKIRLAAGCTYSLSSNHDGDGLPRIVQPIELVGEETTITRTADADPFRILTVGAGGDLTLRHITLSNGRATDEGGVGGGVSATTGSAQDGSRRGRVTGREARTTSGGDRTTRWRDADAGSGGAILVKAGGTLHLEHSTIRDSTASVGGGISNAGVTTLSASTITDNTATDRGGGIHNEGSFSAEHSHVTYNKARYSGGGLENATGVATLKHMAINNNAADVGGGIRSRGDGTTTTVSHSTVSDNSASDDGGGIYNDGGPFILRHTTVSRNTSTGDGGGIANLNVLVAEDSVINANRSSQGNGGGIANQRGQVVLRRSEVTANKATGSDSIGGGIFNDQGEVTLTDSRVIDNSSTQEPGGIANQNGVVNVDHASVIIKNRPTNCEGSQSAVPNCFS